MKVLKYMRNFFFASMMGVLFIACGDDEMIEDPVDFSGTYLQADQKGRPAINTVFVPDNMKDDFNSTTPSNMGSTYTSIFVDRLNALNPGYTTNALGLDDQTFCGILATDVLTVAMSGTTTFFDGTNVLTGRALEDDVIDVELLLIFGGPDGSENPGLTGDNVNSNDKAFLNSFPYLATPW